MLVLSLEISLGELKSIWKNYKHDTDFGLDCMLIRYMVEWIS